MSQDHVRAATFFPRACDGGNLQGCTRLGFALQGDQGVAKDERRAALLYTRACDGGNGLCQRRRRSAEIW